MASSKEGTPMVKVGKKADEVRYRKNPESDPREKFGFNIVSM